MVHLSVFGRFTASSDRVGQQPIGGGGEEYIAWSQGPHQERPGTRDQDYFCMNPAGRATAPASTFAEMLITSVLVVMISDRALSLPA